MEAVVINLNYMPISDLDFYDLIVSIKRSKKSTLVDLRPKIKVRYLEYTDNINNLALISPITFTDQERIDLLHCYEGDTNNIQDLKGYILKSNADRPFCQYCTINTAETTDHYLPKSIFPEFSILPINLIPSCNTCNNKKGDIFIENGFRQIINFYFDPLPIERFIHARIDFRSVPIFRYEINFKHSIPNQTFHLCISHFRKLGLIERFNKVAAGELKSAIRMAKPRNQKLNSDELRQAFINKEFSESESYGVNGWRAIYYGSASANDYFIKYCIAMV